MTIYQFGEEVREIAERIKQQVDAEIVPQQIYGAASSALNLDYRACNSSMFEPNQKTLSLNWVPSDAFKASATQRSSEDFNVNISYGVPKAIFRDAVQMSKVLAKSPAILNVLPLWKSSSIWTKRPEIKSAEVIKGLFELPLQWLFYHEVGHIIEGHNCLSQAKSLLVNENGEFGLDDVANSRRDISEEEAWISHALEISADYQGVRLLIRKLVGVKGAVSELDIWLLVVGVTCLFYRFHGDSSEKFSRGAKGSHPDPTFRFRFLATNILNMVTDETYAKSMPWASSADLVSEVIAHGLAFASSYWNNFNYSGTLIPYFLQEVKLLDAAKLEYLQNVQVKWKEMRPQILNNYFNGVWTSPMDFSY